MQLFSSAESAVTYTPLYSIPTPRPQTPALLFVLLKSL